MNSLIIILIIDFVFGGHDDEMYDWDNLTRDLQSAFSYKGNVCTTIGKSIRQAWRIARNEVCNADYALGTKDAEYFFYNEQKKRDQIYKQLKKWRRGESVSTLSGGLQAIQKYATARDYRKDEYYCRSGNWIDFTFYCKWALYNSKLTKQGWQFDGEILPTCQFRRIFVVRYGYKTKRSVLKCAYKTQNEGEPVRRITAFISAAERSPPNRLILYMFKAKILSDPFTSLRRTSEEEVESEIAEWRTRRRQQNRPRFKEEYDLVPLTVLTLLINKRYIYDFEKGRERQGT